MTRYRQQATVTTTGLATLLLSTLVPTSQGTYPNPGKVKFYFRNTGAVAAFVVVAAEISSSIEIPATGAIVPSDEYDWDDLPKLYVPATAVVITTTLVSGAR